MDQRRTGYRGCIENAFLLYRIDELCMIGT